MAITDENIQHIQEATKDNCTQPKGKIIDVGKNGKHEYYKVVNSTNGQTQAIAVAPCDDKQGHGTDYSQTTITVAGTQTPDDKTSYYAASVLGALAATEGMTYQYEQVQSFAEDTQKEVENHKGGKIAAMGGHSQAAPAVAKVGADMKVGKIINFQPWASEAAVNDKSSRGINADEKKYLDKHCHTYTDSGKNTVKYDGSGGKCAYGKIYVAEGSSHDVGFFHIKGNGLNVDYYYKNNKFCSGMTEEQVKTIAGIKAGSQSSANPNAFIQEYKDKFGSYAKSKKANKTSTQAANLLNSQRAKISAMPAKLYKHGKGKSGRGGKRILLRPGGISGITSKAVASAHQAESKLEQVTEEAKQDIWQIINDTRDEAFAIAPHLPAGEIESLLADLDFHNCWNEGTESRNQSQIHQYVSKVEALADNIEEASDSIQAADKEEASDITLL